MAKQDGSEPVTKLELIEMFEDRETALIVSVTSTIRETVNGNLEKAIQSFEIKSMERDKIALEMMNEIKDDHTEAMNKMNMNMQKVANAVKQSLRHTKRLFEITDEIRETKLPEIQSHIDQQKGAAKFWFSLVGLAAAVGACAGLIALLR